MDAERYVMSGGRAPRLASKEGDLFLYTNDVGQTPGNENSELGLYYRDTRYLSRFELLVAGRPPVLLSSTAERGYGATIELTNLESRTIDGRLLPQAGVHMRRTRYLADRLHESMHVHNYHHAEVELAVDLHFAADFADLFEVRGLRRRRHGTRLAAREATDALVLAYYGLDDVLRETVVRFLDPPGSIRQGRARYQLRLAPGERTEICFEVQIVVPDPPPVTRGGFREKLAELRDERQRWDAGATESSPTTSTSTTCCGAARRSEDARSRRGWAAYRPLRRALVRGALRAPDALRRPRDPILDLRWSQAAVDYLGAQQGKAESAFREEQPGRIMHELRRGELAALRAIPHTPYYGSIDATPLWLLLMTEMTMWTGDLECFDQQRAAIDAALAWLDAYGDLDGDGFVEYRQRSHAGLNNQGWRDGTTRSSTPTGPPAQGPDRPGRDARYVFYAKRRLAAIFGQLGDVERSQRLQAEAAALQTALQRALLDGRGGLLRHGPRRREAPGEDRVLDGRPRVCGRASSPTNTCRAWSGDSWRRDMYTGWGVRTISEEMRGYNPVSFYDGSVWPHDTAIAACGMKKHGYAQESNRWRGARGGRRRARVLPTAGALLRLPRQAINKPVSFPMACSPDAGSAGALFLILQSMVGVYAQAEANIVYVHNPVLPKWLGEVTFGNLRVGRTTMRLRFRREGGQTTFTVLDKQGPGRIIVVG